MNAEQIEYLKKLVASLAEWQLCMSYNDSYFGEPAGLVKRTSRELTKLIESAERTTAPVSLTDAQIIEAIDRPGFAWENLDAAEQRNLLGSIRALLAAAPAPIQKEPTLIAYVATDLDGRYDVGTTPEKAKERAGHGCDTVFPIYDIGANATPARVDTVGRDAASDVLAERERQKQQEGWTAEHDDQYQDGELCCAAACYTMANDSAQHEESPNLWPWPEDWWKPTTERRNLVKAGALILAEIERLDRAAKPNADCSGEPANCPDNEGYGCACDPMNKAAMTNPEYIERASKITFPDWATHAAINMFDDRVEPAAWDERANAVIGEDPATLKNGDWATTYKRAYWRVIPLSEITPLKQITRAVP